MSVIFVVLPLALLVVLAAVIAFRWAARSGQFDDLDTPPMRALHDDVEKKRGPPANEGGAATPDRSRSEDRSHG